MEVTPVPANPAVISPPVAAAPPPSPPQRLAQLLGAATEHEQAGRLDLAEAILSQVLGEFPEQPGALHMLGIVSFKRGRIAEAAALMERSIAHAGTTALYHRNICEVYRVLGRYDEAMTAGRRAVSLSPDDPHCYNNLGVTCYHRLDLDGAIECAERAIALDAVFAGAHFGMAEALLLRGEFERGWEEYEWRFKLANAPRLMPPFERPQWDGRPLGDGILMLIADQGYGDVIQFSRYIPWAAERCRNIALACSSEIRGVAMQQQGIGQVFDHWDNRPDFAAFCPLSGLPRLAGTRLGSIPAPIPYLRGDPERTAGWAARLAALVPRGYRRIGIAWAGRPTHTNDRNRSMSLQALSPLFRLPQVAFISLQKGPGQAQIGNYWGTAPLLSLGPEVADYGDTMAIVESLDLVLTVDTSVGHLAGAMGKPVWIMLPFAPDWRWLLERSDSPWYPTARLYRQPDPGNWNAVIAQVYAALERGE